MSRRRFSLDVDAIRGSTLSRWGSFCEDHDGPDEGNDVLQCASSRARFFAGDGVEGSWDVDDFHL